jgi:hypothetical protein
MKAKTRWWLSAILAAGAAGMAGDVSGQGICGQNYNPTGPGDQYIATKTKTAAYMPLLFAKRTIVAIATTMKQASRVSAQLSMTAALCMDAHT